MIGYYIHHQGGGHLARASTIARHSAEDVVALSSLAEPREHDFAAWVRLAPDPPVADPDSADAGGALHWAPLNSADYRARMHRLTDWCHTARPRLVVVDVSVEVAAALRLAGVPVVVVAMPGSRGDSAHTLAYRMAEAVIAPWPRELYVPAHLEPFGSKTSYVGAFSRFDAAPVRQPPDPRTALVLFGSGGGGAPPGALAALEDATGWTCHAVGGEDGRWSDDVWSSLCAAEVVITHGGLNSVAEVAAAARPAIVLPQPRPFGEQVATAAALSRAGLAAVLDSWPEPSAWPRLLADAGLRGGTSWKRWNDRCGAQRSAALLESVRPTVS